MRYYLYVDQAGFVTSAANGVGEPAEVPGLTVVEVSGPVDILSGPPGHRLRASDLQWVDSRTLEQAKEAKNAEINAARLAANQSTFTFANKQIAVDPLSRSDIDGANGIISLTGALPGGWPGAWKAVDNTYVAIPDISTWTAFYAAMVTQGTTNFVYSQQLKAALAAATTLQQVDAIYWGMTV